MLRCLPLTRLFRLSGIFSIGEELMRKLLLAASLLTWIGCGAEEPVIAPRESCLPRESRLECVGGAAQLKLEPHSVQQLSLLNWASPEISEIYVGRTFIVHGTVADFRLAIAEGVIFLTHHELAEGDEVGGAVPVNFVIRQIKLSFEEPEELFGLRRGDYVYVEGMCLGSFADPFGDLQFKFCRLVEEPD